MVRVGIHFLLCLEVCGIHEILTGNNGLQLHTATLTFYVQTWDEYYTQTLILGIVSGPVEGILTLCIVYAFTAVKGGGSFWQQSMFETIGIAKHGIIPDYIYELPFNEWYMVYGGIVLVFNTLQRCGPGYYEIFLSWNKLTRSHCSILHVIQVRRERNQNAESPLTGLFPFFARWILVAIYLYQQPVILHYHLVPFIFYVGLINAFSVGQIIIAHLTKSPDFPRNNILSFPLGLAVLDSMGPILGLWSSVLGDGTYQIAFVFSCLGLAVGVYGSFIVSFFWIFSWS